MTMRAPGALLALVFVFTALPARAAKPVQVAGAYSSFRYNAEGGDLLGEELWIVPVPDGYQGTLQFSEGEPGYLILVKVIAEGDSIRFSVPAPNAYAGDFRGRVSPEGIRGTFTMQNGNRIEISLKRALATGSAAPGADRAPTARSGVSSIPGYDAQGEHMRDAAPRASRIDGGAKGVFIRIRKALSLVPFLPEFRRRWSAAIDAAHRGQWPVVIGELSVIHERGYATDDSHFWMGCAHANLSDWAAAEAQLGAIHRPLGRKEWEAARLSNRAEALAHLGRAAEAADFLTATRPAWPAGHEAMLAGLLDALRAGISDGGEERAE